MFSSSCSFRSFVFRFVSSMCTYSTYTAHNIFIRYVSRAAGSLCAEECVMQVSRALFGHCFVRVVEECRIVYYFHTLVLQRSLTDWIFGAFENGRRCCCCCCCCQRRDVGWAIVLRVSVCALHECVDVDSGSEANNNKRLFYAFICIRFNLFFSLLLLSVSFLFCMLLFLLIFVYVRWCLITIMDIHTREIPSPHKAHRLFVRTIAVFPYSYMIFQKQKAGIRFWLFFFYFSFNTFLHTCFLVDAAISCFSHFWFASTSQYIEFGVECKERKKEKERERDWSSPLRDA